MEKEEDILWETKGEEKIGQIQNCEASQSEIRLFRVKKRTQPMSKKNQSCKEGRQRV